MLDSLTFEPNPLDVDFILPIAEQGYPEELAKQDREAGALFAAGGSASITFPDIWEVKDGDLEELCAENDKRRTWPLNRRSRFTNQHPTDECTNHSGTCNFEIARNGDLGLIYHEGPKVGFTYEESRSAGDVFFSCMFPYNRAQPRISGGANVRTIIQYMMEEGLMPDHIQPHEYGFACTMPGTMGGGNSNQSHGLWVPYKSMPNGWRDVAKWFKPKEIVYPASWREGLSLVVRGRAVSVGRNGHAVPYSFYSYKTRMMGYIDSYNVIRWDSERLWKSCIASGSFSIITTTQPTDRMKPAGK